jgi:uncharacterized protein with WD repeat
MTVTADMITKFRRMINEPTAINYSDDELETYIESWAVDDEFDNKALILDYSTTPYSYITNTSWVPTYDLNAAAAEIWEEKAADIQDEFDFSAEGGNYTRSQKYQQAINMASRYKSHSKAKSVLMHKYPKEHNTDFGSNYKDI